MENKTAVRQQPEEQDIMSMAGHVTDTELARLAKQVLATFGADGWIRSTLLSQDEKLQRLNDRLDEVVDSLMELLDEKGA